MGAEEKAPTDRTPQVEETEANQSSATASAATPAEEPPKLEEIVTDEVLAKIINGYNPDLSLVAWKSQIGTSAGDNYMSIMYALELELGNTKSKNNEIPEKLQVMLKTLPRNIFRADLINEMKAFKVESDVYTNILPVFLDVQKEKGIPKEDVFRAWPICYAAHLDGKTDFLAMEDLKVSGFKMGSRLTGLDFNHCAIVLRNLAKYHAISYAKFDGNVEKIRETFPLLNRDMYEKSNKTSEMSQQFFVQTYKGLAAALQKTGEELACSRMEKIANADILTILSDLIRKNVEHAVITHGDCWVNNIMFKYGSDEQLDSSTSCPIGSMFIDFQLCQASSRLLDVFYFLITSSKFGVLNEREEDLLMIYYTEFTSFAERLGVKTKEKGLTWQNFLKEANQYRLFGILSGLLLTPLFAAESEDVPNLDEFTQEDFDNADDTIKKFYKDLSKGNIMQKVKSILVDQLPKCSNVEQFL